MGRFSIEEKRMRIFKNMWKRKIEMQFIFIAPQANTKRYHSATDSDHLIALSFTVHIPLKLPAFAYMLLHEDEVIVEHYFRDAFPQEIGGLIT